MSEVVIVMTCHNRKEKTVNCISKLHEGNIHNIYHYIVVDDLSTDGTSEAVKALGFADVDIVLGDGNLFWNGGMHKGITEAVLRYGQSSHILLVNDDVEFIPGVIDSMLSYFGKLSKEKKTHPVLVGATMDDEGKLSYGGILYKRGLNYDKIGPDKPDIQCTTFNANCTLIPMSVMTKAGNVDPHYRHSMGDFDLGFKVSRMGNPIYVYPEYVGRCNDNPIEGTWQDPSLGIIRRLKLKESFKGLPFKDWFHYLHKNFGLGTACIRSVTPYIKIFLGK